MLAFSVRHWQASRNTTSTEMDRVLPMSFDIICRHWTAASRARPYCDVGHRLLLLGLLQSVLLIASVFAWYDIHIDLKISNIGYADTSEL
eukprot:scaffold284024_cov32-Prasinocladus_malaysianus.AAC.1